MQLNYEVFHVVAGPASRFARCSASGYGGGILSVLLIPAAPRLRQGVAAVEGAVARRRALLVEGQEVGAGELLPLAFA